MNRVSVEPLALRFPLFQVKGYPNVDEPPTARIGKYPWQLLEHGQSNEDVFVRNQRSKFRSGHCIPSVRWKQ